MENINTKKEKKNDKDKSNYYSNKIRQLVLLLGMRSIMIE